MEKPKIAIVNTSSELSSCFSHLDGVSAEVKQAITGYGNADKRQIQEMVQRLLQLREAPRPDDAADGVAVAVCHLQHSRYALLS